MISVVIPVGPYPANVKWLQEALDSVLTQTQRPEQVLLINDGHVDLSQYMCKSVREWCPPWRSGVAHSFNFGVALAETPLVLMMGSDDILKPECIERILDAYTANHSQDAYYWLDVEYMSTGNKQSIPCNAAAVTKGLWNKTGGIPIEAACGAGDAALLSIMMVHMPKLIKWVPSDEPLYVYRDHPDTDTIHRGAWHQLIIDVRDLVTREWNGKVSNSVAHS